MNTIPYQVFLEIASHLSVDDLSKLAQVNKRFYQLCQLEMVWRPRIVEKTGLEVESATRQDYQDLFYLADYFPRDGFHHLEILEIFRKEELLAWQRGSSDRKVWLYIFKAVGCLQALIISAYTQAGAYIKVKWFGLP